MMKSKLHHLKTFISRVRRARETGSVGARVVPVALFVAAGTATVIGCAWDGIYHSVRFNVNYTKDEREFQRLPPMIASSNAAPAVSTEDYDYEAEQAQLGKLDEMWQQVIAAQEQGELEHSRRLLREYLSSTLQCTQTDCQQRRNSARDQLDALEALDEGTPHKTLQAYLSARRSYDAGAPKETSTYYYGNKPTQPVEARPTTEEIQAQLDAVPPDSHVQDNVAYLRAALLYREQKFDEAAQAFKALTAKYPRSEKREAALFMAALSTYKQSNAFNSASATAEKPCTECRDEYWQAAHDLFTRLLREHPRGQYAADARGWLAHLALRVGDTAKGLAEYYRLLANADDPNARVEGLLSLRLARAHTSEEDMRQLEAQLADEPQAALAYAYHNIYNYTHSYYLAVPEKNDEAETSSDGNEYYGASLEDFQSEQESQKTRSAVEQRELERIVTFASGMLRKFPRAGATGAFSLRVAQANLELNKPREAAEFARRALISNLKDAERDDALWVKGCAEYRLHQYDAARATLRQLVAAEGTRGRLAEGARRLMALIAEDAGDLDDALQQYLALEYDTDVAYFIDVLMTPEQLAAFIELHPKSEKIDELKYALGLRYLRADRLSEARAVYTEIRATQQSDYFHDYNYGGRCELGNSYETIDCSDPKSPYGEAGEIVAGVRPRWVLRDLQTANDLEHLERCVELAQGDEAKAEAMYQLASYIYMGGDYLFYNTGEWNGTRYLNLSSLDEFHKYRAPNEAQRLWQYMQEHETPARALEIYLQIVERYPQTRAARDAFYTAAVCHERLANFNQYWRNAYASGLHAGQRMVTYQDVKSTYPDYKFPRGTSGWQPDTRTVKGGPGWAAPPKPLPRPTRRERVQHYLSLAYAWAVDFWEQKLRRWLTIGLILCGLHIVRRRAARHRKALRFKLARRKLRQTAETVETPTWRAINELEEEAESDFRVRAKRVMLVALSRARGLALDARLRPALAANAISHGLLVALLLTLGWMFYGR